MYRNYDYVYILGFLIEKLRKRKNYIYILGKVKEKERRAVVDYDYDCNFLLGNHTHAWTTELIISQLIYLFDWLLGNICSSYGQSKSIKF